MGKHEKKKKDKEKLNYTKKTNSFLEAMDSKLNYHYDEIVEEIDDMQNSLEKIDLKAKKRARKKAKGDNDKYVKYYLSDKNRKKERRKKLEKYENESGIEIVADSIRDAKPLLELIGRLGGAIILVILSADIIKVYLSKKDISLLKSIYKFFMRRE